MSWGEVSSDQIDEAFAHFHGLSSAGFARVCELIVEVDVRQSWMTDGARTLSDWVSTRLRVRHETASLLVRVAKRLVHLPVLSERFSAGDLSLDQTDAISKMATADTEKGLIEEALGLSNTALDRAARRVNPPTRDDEAETHRSRGVLDSMSVGWRVRTVDGSSTQC